MLSKADRVLMTHSADGAKILTAEFLEKTGQLLL